MDLEIIKTVLTVARLKSFSAAAYAIPCAQSSVSRRVKSAEDELDIKIFYRPSADDSKTVELTPLGKKAIEVMAKIIDDYSELYKISEPEKPSPVILNLGIREYIMTPMGISLLKGDFYEQQPQISLFTKFDNMKTMISGLRLRYLDAALFVCASLDSEKCAFDDNLVLTYLGKSAFSVGVSNKSPLAKEESVTLSMLKDETFLIDGDPKDVMPGIEYWTRERILSICMSSFTPKITAIPNIMREGRYKLASENRGIFPSFAPKPWRRLDDITYLTVSDIECPAHYYLLHVRGRMEKEVFAFADFFSKRLAEV